jgi:Fic family protein
VLILIFNINELPDFCPTLDTLGHSNYVEYSTGLWSKTAGLSKEFVDSLKKTTIITSSGASTRIENALMTDEEIGEFVAKGKAITNLSSRSEREVAGYIKVLEYLYETAGSDLVSQHSIKTLHQMMTTAFTNEMLAPKLRGAYKNVPNNVVEQDETGNVIRVWFETTPPGPQTDSSMEELVKAYHGHLEAGTPSLIVIAWFIVHFLAIHPFQDGNGRLSCLLTIWLLMRAGYNWIPYVSHEKFIEDNKDRYYASLRQTQASFLTDKINYEPWISFFCLIMSRQAKYLEDQVINKVDANLQSMKLGPNEEKVVAALTRIGRLGRADLVREVAMSDIGMKRLLKRLRDRGVIMVEGKGKSTKYSLGNKY